MSENSNEKKINIIYPKNDSPEKRRENYKAEFEKYRKETEQRLNENRNKENQS